MHPNRHLFGGQTRAKKTSVVCRRTCGTGSNKICLDHQTRNWPTINTARISLSCAIFCHQKRKPNVPIGKLEPNEVENCCLEMEFSHKRARQTDRRINAEYDSYATLTFYERLAKKCDLPPSECCSPYHTNRISELLKQCKSNDGLTSWNLQWYMNFHLRAILTTELDRPQLEVNQKVNDAIEQAFRLKFLSEV
jgi:hypothetical protein